MAPGCQHCCGPGTRALLRLPTPVGTFGEYGPLIPILGCSIRGLRRERNWVSAAVLLVLTALQVHDYPGPGYLYIFGGLVWVAIIAALWLIGAGFAAARSAALAEQRLILARDLHDTVARTVARVSLSAGQVRRGGVRLILRGSGREGLEYGLGVHLLGCRGGL